MSSVRSRFLARENGDPSYRESLGIVFMPDVVDNCRWDTIVLRGIPYFDEWSNDGIILPSRTVGFALSYKHTEHQFGKLSQEQADELRAILSRLVGPGADKAAVWVDSMYMTREALGLRDFSSTWVRYGLLPYQNLPVLRLKSQWELRHTESGKLSAWLWMERNIGTHNYGVHTIEGFERQNRRRLNVAQVLYMWLNVCADFGFRPCDENAVRMEIDGSLVESNFTCPGRCACIAFMLGTRDNPCGGQSDECIQLAMSTRGCFHGDKLILASTATIADSVLFVTEPDPAGEGGNLERLLLSAEQLRPYTRFLSAREVPLRNIRLLDLERFSLESFETG